MSFSNSIRTLTLKLIFIQLPPNFTMSIHQFSLFILTWCRSTSLNCTNTPTCCYPRPIHTFYKGPPLHSLLVYSLLFFVTTVALVKFIFMCVKIAALALNILFDSNRVILLRSYCVCSHVRWKSHLCTRYKCGALPNPFDLVLVCHKIL